MLIIYPASIIAYTCRVDDDCRLSQIPDFNSLYCINKTCQKLRKEGSPCNRPQECASFSYYGPLACSSKCKSTDDCNSNIIEKTTFCCKAIPKLGECNINRPGSLSGCSSAHACLMNGEKSFCLDKKEKSWLFGVVLSVSGNILITMGINFQKKSYSSSSLKIANYSFNTLILGSVIYGLGKMVSFAAYVFGSQSLLAGLSATGLVSNSILAPMINNENFTWNDLTAIILVAIGSSIIVYNTNSAHIIYSMCELTKMYKQTGTILWFIFLIIVICCLYATILFVETNSDWADDGISLMRTDVYFDNDGFVRKYLMVLVYVLLSSFIASFTTLSAKSLGEIIGKSLGGENLLLGFEPYFLIFSLIFCTFLQIYWLNRALKHYDALLVIPMFHVSWTILSILTAAIYFQDFDHYSYSQLKYFIFGVVIIFFGSFFLALRIVNRSYLRSTEMNVREQAKDD